MLELFKPLYSNIIKYGAIGLATLFFLFRIRQSGADSVKKDQLTKTLEEIQARDKIENNINNANDSVYKRLYKKWSR